MQCLLSCYRDYKIYFRTLSNASQHVNQSISQSINLDCHASHTKYTCTGNEAWRWEHSCILYHAVENARPISSLCYNECVCPFADSVSVEDPLEPWTPPPQYLPSPTDITVRAGDRAVLPCGIQNLGTKQVTLPTVSLVLHALGIQILGTKQVTLSTVSLGLHAMWNTEYRN